MKTRKGRAAHLGFAGMPGKEVRIVGRNNADARRSEKVFERALAQVLRQYRMQCGLSQEKLAARVEMTFQQIQKYERATNRVTVARLILLTEALDTDPVTMLREAIDQALDDPHCTAHRRRPDRKAFQLAKACARIQDDSVRDAVLSLLKAVAAEEGTPGDVLDDVPADWVRTDVPPTDAGDANPNDGAAPDAPPSA